MRTYVISAFIDKKLDVYGRKMVSLKTLRSIKNNWNKHFKELCLQLFTPDIGGDKSKLFEFEKGKFVNVNTLYKVITAYRAKVKELSIDLNVDQKITDWLLKDGVKLNKSTFRGVINLPIEIEQKREKGVTKRTNKRKQKPLILDDLQAIYDVCYEFLNSPVWYEKTIGLMFFTGRRLAEIIKVGKLTNTGADNVLNFRGQLKTRSTNGYTIPVFHSKQVLRTFKELRVLRPDFVRKHIDVATRSAQTTLNKHIKRQFGESMSTHKLRSIYGLMMEYYNNQGTKHKTTFISEILGHKLSNEGSTANTTERYELLRINFNLKPEIAQQLERIQYIYKEV